MADSQTWQTGPLSHAVFRLARAHKALAGRLLREAGVHPGQELVLMALWHEGPQRQVDLVHACESDAPTMARSIARLEKAGLVRRGASPTDRRAMVVEATEASHQIRETIERAWAELERLTVGDLSERRQREILKGLAALEANVSAADGAGSGT